MTRHPFAAALSAALMVLPSGILAQPAKDGRVEVQPPMPNFVGTVNTVDRSGRTITMHDGTTFALGPDVRAEAIRETERVHASSR